MNTVDIENSEYQNLLVSLEDEHRTLRFETFDNQAALSIGLYLLERAKKDDLPIAIDIRLGNHQLFHCALEGTSEENDQWVLRKNRVALRFQKSSYYISILLKSENTTIEERYQLSSIGFAPYGGSYPVMDKEGTVIGTITVSGLPDHEDHAIVVEAIKWYLSKKNELA